MAASRSLKNFRHDFDRTEAGVLSFDEERTVENGSESKETSN